MGLGQIKIPLLGILLLTLSHHLTDQFAIETSEYSDPLEYNCDKVHFDKETYVRCTCLDGIWAVLIAHPIGDSRQWKLYGVDKACVHLGVWITKIHKLSNSATQSTLSILPMHQRSSPFKKIKSISQELMPEKKLQYVVTNTNNWQLTILKDDGAKENICLPGAGLYRYCTYIVSSIIAEDVVDQKDLMGEDCSSDAKVFYPVTCDDLLPPVPDVNDDPLICNLIPPSTNQIRKKREEDSTKNQIRIKRQAQVTPDTTTTDPSASPPPANPPPSNGPPVAAPTDGSPDPAELDETAVQSPSPFSGDKPFIDSISHYMMSHIIDLAGFKKPDKSKTIIPVTNLLRKSVQLMKKICNPIKDEIWDMALGAFLRHQKNVYHMKEPYIGYAAYQRILNTLDTCIAQSKPFVFQTQFDPVDLGYNPDTKTKMNMSICESETESSGSIKWPTGHFKLFRQLTFASHSNAMKFEPLIETVWKAFVTTHSHCFRHFSDYYNDHHTYTVAIIPFFTNEIQKIWMLDPKKPDQLSPETDPDNGKEPSYLESKNWYGGFIANASTIFWNLDNCYGAARGYYVIPDGLQSLIADSQPDVYPWQMNRPLPDDTNRWTRKKRDTNSKIVQAPCVNSQHQT